MPGWSASAIEGVLSRHPDLETLKLAEADVARLPQVLREFQPDIVLVPANATGVAGTYYDLLRQDRSVHLVPMDVVPYGADLYELRLLERNVGAIDLVAVVRAISGHRSTGPILQPPARNCRRG